MRISRLAAVVPLALAAAIAGCGSSSTKTTSAAPAASSSSGGGGYGYSGSSSTASSAAPSATPVVLTTKHAKLGTILAAGPKRMTVYLFEADRTGVSNCSAACAAVWPPVTGSARAAGAAMAADLGTVKRSDGTTQLTYKGHPLYYYVRDKDDGDSYGQGIKSFGAGWYVLRPSGQKVDNS